MEKLWLLEKNFKKILEVEKIQKNSRAGKTFRKNSRNVLVLGEKSGKILEMF